MQLSWITAAINSIADFGLRIGGLGKLTPAIQSAIRNPQSAILGMPSLLLTGVPGSGKTTVIRKVAERLAGHRLAGFLTDEIRSEHGREGFRMITLDGHGAVMAHVGFRMPHRVGKYGVDVPAIDRLVEFALKLDPRVNVYVVDEIGKMECLSEAFVERMQSVLDSGKPVVASVAQKGEGFVREVKGRPDAVVWQVTHQNRNALPDSVFDWIKAELKR